MNASISLRRNLKEDIYLLIAEIIRECVLFLLHLFDEGEQIEEFSEFQSQSKLLNGIRKVKQKVKTSVKRKLNFLTEKACCLMETKFEKIQGQKRIKQYIKAMINVNVFQ